MKITLLCAVVLAAVMPSPPARAESLGVVAVAEPPGPSAELAELTHQLRAVVAERAQGVLEAAELRERMTGQTSSATLAELDRAYAGALATYQSGDFAGAVRTLRAVIEDLERLSADPEAFSQWTRAMLRLARSEQTLGRGGEAREVLERLVRANPTVEANTTQYPPSFVKQVEEARAQAAALPRRRLTVTVGTGAGKGAKVYVEGREVGVTPLTVELPPGRYRVSGALGAVRVPNVPADLSEEDQSVVLNFTLAEALRPAIGPGLALSEADRARSLVSAGNCLGVDRLLAARLQTESGVEYLSAAIYDVRRGILQREGRVRLANKMTPPGGLSALATFLITGQASQLVAMPPTPAAASAENAGPPTPAEATKPSLAVKPPPEAATGNVDFSTPSTLPARKSKALGWAAVGAGALSVGLGAFAVYEGLSAQSSYGDASDLLQEDGAVQVNASVAQYRQFVDDGDSAKSTAYLSGGAAIGCAAASGVLGYLSYKRTGEIGPFRF